MRTYPVWERRVVHQAMYCEEHAGVFLTNYLAKELSGHGSPLGRGGAVGFDVELVVCDYRPDRPCRFFLRELGGVAI